MLDAGPPTPQSARARLPQQEPPRGARLARAVFPDLPHHMTQRGSDRQQTFFDDADYALYRNLMCEHCAGASVSVWAWVLMPNRVHLILVPTDEDGIRRPLARVRRIYAGRIHERLQRTGHVWQGRIGCVGMDEAHCPAALRYGRPQPRPRGSGQTRFRLAMVERAGTVGDRA